MKIRTSRGRERREEKKERERHKQKKDIEKVTILNHLK